MTRYTLIVPLILLLLSACGVNVPERNNEGNLRLIQGSYDQAIASYQEALIADPDNATIYFNLGNAYLRMADLASAEAAYLQAVLRGNEGMAAAALYNLGNMYFSADRFEDAVMSYQDALRITPSWGDAQFNLELALSMIEQPTSTPMEMQTELDTDQVDDQTTPTPNPGGQSLPTPTPPPPEQLVGPTPEGGGETGVQVEDERVTPIPEPLGELSVEQAQHILDAVELDQAGVGGLIDPLQTMPTPASSRDW